MRTYCLSKIPGFILGTYYLCDFCIYCTTLFIFTTSIVTVNVFLSSLSPIKQHQICQYSDDCPFFVPSTIPNSKQRWMLPFLLLYGASPDLSSTRVQWVRALHDARSLQTVLNHECHTIVKSPALFFVLTSK